MPVEVRTRSKFTTGEIIIEMLFVPRGSGNRNKARALADAWEKEPRLSPHISKIVCGASRVTVHLKASVAAMAAVAQAMDEARAEKSREVEGQLPLFTRLMSS